METSPLPNQDDESSDSGLSFSDDGSLIHWVARLTPCGKFTSDELIAFITNEPEICQYVVGKESVPQEHYHLVLSTDSSLSFQEVRDIIRSFVVPLWTDPETHKCPRGFGNKQYNLQECKEHFKAVSYAVKQGEYWFEGYTQEFIDAAKAESFEKKKPSDFKSEYTDLSNRFQESDMDIREFMTAFCVLKAKYGQQVNMSTAYQFAVSNAIKRDNNASEFVENFLYKI